MVLNILRCLKYKFQYKLQYFSDLDFEVVQLFRTVDLCDAYFHISPDHQLFLRFAFKSSVLVTVIAQLLHLSLCSREAFRCSTAWTTGWCVLHQKAWTLATQKV